MKKFNEIVEKRDYIIHEESHLYKTLINQGDIVVGDYLSLDLMFGINSEVFISDDKIANQSSHLMPFSEGLA